MKKIALLLFLVAFTYSVSAQENYLKLQDVKSLASINKSTYSLINKNIDKINSTNELAPLSLSKKTADKNASKPKKWNFSIMPYAWYGAFGGTVGEGPQGGVYGFNKGFSFDNLKMYAAGVGKIKYERVSFVFDISYISKKSFDATASTPNLPANVVANWTSDWTVQQTVYDLFIAYLFPSKSKKTMVDIYGGGRLWDLNLESTFTNATADTSVMTNRSNSWLDPVIGVNAEFVLDKKGKWAAWTKGDIGGFGVNSQMTWQMNVGVAYMLSPNFPLAFGFKYLGVNYYKNELNWTVNEYGPTLGIGYRY